MKTKKYLKIASLAVVAAIFIWTFVFLYRKSQPTVKVYETIVPETADLEKTTVATGKVEPRDEVLIKPQISGIISEVYKEAGQSVKQGEVIAKVKVIPELGTLNSAESRVRLAEINAKQAETDFARVEKLFNDKLISNEEYEKGEVNVKQAREELQTAKDNLEIVKEGITKNSASFSPGGKNLRLHFECYSGGIVQHQQQFAAAHVGNRTRHIPAFHAGSQPRSRSSQPHRRKQPVGAYRRFIP